MTGWAASGDRRVNFNVGRQISPTREALIRFWPLRATSLCVASDVSFRRVSSVLRFPVPSSFSAIWRAAWRAIQSRICSDRVAGTQRISRLEIDYPLPGFLTPRGAQVAARPTYADRSIFFELEASYSLRRAVILSGLSARSVSRPRAVDPFFELLAARLPPAVCPCAFSFRFSPSRRRCDTQERFAFSHRAIHLLERGISSTLTRYDSNIGALGNLLFSEILSKFSLAVRSALLPIHLSFW